MVVDRYCVCCMNLSNFGQATHMLLFAYHEILAIDELSLLIQTDPKLKLFSYSINHAMAVC